MRGMGYFFGSARRNQPVKLENPHPVTNYGTSSLESGNAGLDGFTVLSKAEPNRQGQAPPVAGTVGPVYWGPSQDWEQ